jgi:Raf kinase inhibitor-like YbhB/YbcL family protein
MPTRPHPRAHLDRAARLAAPLLAAVLAACASGGDDDDGDEGATADATPIADATSDLFDAGFNPFTLTSTAFAAGDPIPPLYTCEGKDLSPPLAWSGAPEAAGLALVVTDLDNGLVHSVLWDIPGDATSLPEGIEKVAEPAEPAGSRQALSFDDETRGYRGPCPPKEHTYEFTLYVLADNPVAGVTLDSTRETLVATFMDRSVAQASLRGTFTPAE